MASEQGAGKREEAAVLERVQDFLRNNPDQAFRIPSWTMRYWTNAEVAAFALSEIALAKRETMEECCKLVCPDGCGEECELVVEPDGFMWHVLKSGAHVSCLADAIRRKMAEMK